MSWQDSLNNNMHNFQKLNVFLSTLDQRGKIQAEYIWIGGEGELRSKTRTLNSKPKSPSEIPEWNYDGSSTKQAPGDDSEVILKPRAIFADPFRRGDNILVLCDTWDPSTDAPLPSNTRAKAKEIFDQCLDHKPWFGIEQEFVLTYPKDCTKMYGWPSEGFPAPQGPYYCSVGAGNALGREVIEAHYRCCLHAGIQISGCNAEVMCSQWEYQVGPVEGIAIGDQLYVSRWIMHRVGEIFNTGISFDPKPVSGDWNGSGGHVNFSTEPMRKEGGLKVMEEAMEKLAKAHKEHIAVYGTGNEKRLTGQHETSSMEKFSWGVANRGASVRIGRDSHREGKGYFEDRRPASNLDPYVVSSMLVKTCCLDK